MHTNLRPSCFIPSSLYGNQAIFQKGSQEAIDGILSIIRDSNVTFERKGKDLSGKTQCILAFAGDKRRKIAEQQQCDDWALFGEKREQGTLKTILSGRYLEYGNLLISKVKDIKNGFSLLGQKSVVNYFSVQSAINALWNALFDNNRPMLMVQSPGVADQDESVLRFMLGTGILGLGMAMFALGMRTRCEIGTHIDKKSYGPLNIRTEAVFRKEIIGAVTIDVVVRSDLAQRDIMAVYTVGWIAIVANNPPSQEAKILIDEQVRACCQWEPTEGVEQLKEHVAILRYLLAQASFYERGSAAVAEWLEKAIYLYHGFDFTYRYEGEDLTRPLGDLDAYTQFSLTDYIECYRLKAHLDLSLIKSH